MSADEGSPLRGKEAWSKAAVVSSACGELATARVLATLRMWDRYRLVANADCTLGLYHAFHRLVGQDPYEGASPTLLPEGCKNGASLARRRRFEELFGKVTMLSETVSNRSSSADRDVV